ncbi:MAG: hypothetical protein U9R12_04405, partial [Candidatus Caldatribacteriota bacterium]|nr:hypothetical protein [Candidatus Caldatribacteriota bacterium]
IDTANSICSDAEDLIDKMLELGRDRGLLKEPDDQKQSRTYKKCLNIDKLTSKQLSDLKEKVVEVHLNIWIPLHCNLDFAFNTMDGQYPYFIYDDDDWCLATEPKGKVVDFDDFISMLEKQGKENNE